MYDPIERLVKSWGSNDLSVVNRQIAHLERWLFKSYEPDKFNSGDFWHRLNECFSKLNTDAEKQSIFHLVTKILYLGPVEFEELYRCAYDGPIARWLVDLEGIDVFATDASVKLKQAARETWFCPVTDSFRVNAFFHINNLSVGTSLRPDWRSLCELADEGKLNNYCVANGIKRLVLLEDFVGGGSQSMSAVHFAATLTHGLNVLFVPLVICPGGHTRALALERVLCAKRADSLRYEAVLRLPDNAFLTPTSAPIDIDDPMLGVLRQTIEDTYIRVSGGAPLGTKPYHPYGYPVNKPTGSLVVMYSNTPDNTLPLIHWRPAGSSWSPIFPRHTRE